ncbi:hypothetical protein C8R45DRAFT_926153 [Mycena sanguinolenta]|nr:hypothetical protein C8R45DRAFT_926153 [Mycena sanguinolenta]
MTCMFLAFRSSGMRPRAKEFGDDLSLSNKFEFTGDYLCTWRAGPRDTIAKRKAQDLFLIHTSYSVAAVVILAAGNLNKRRKMDGYWIHVSYILLARASSVYVPGPLLPWQS